METPAGRWCPPRGCGWGNPHAAEKGRRDGDDVFVGTHERQLDPKGRLALPAAFRPQLEPRCFLVLGDDKCVTVWTSEDFKSFGQEMLDKVRRGEMGRDQLRAISSSAAEVTIDGQGRVLLTEEMRTFAGLSLNSKVIVTGAFDRVEIWEPTRFGRIASAGTEKIAGAGQ